MRMNQLTENKLTMPIHIENLNSTVHTVDEESILSPVTMQKIVATVLAVIQEQDDHQARVVAEQRISNGVSYELNREA